MKAHLVQFSTVVVGNVHNPSILSPAFLRAEDIVPAAWAWEVAETLTTPAFALVRYSNGVSINVEPNKLQVIDLSVGSDPTQSKATAIAARYVVILPHVHYTAVGMNFQSIIEHDASDSYLKERFLKSGDWNTARGPLQAVGLRLVYELPEGGRVTLSLDAGEVQRTEEQENRKALIARANFHRECTQQSAAKEVREHFDRLTNDWPAYCKLLTKAVGCEE